MRRLRRPIDALHEPLAYAMAYAMSTERNVKLFRNGRNQAVRIPREFELPGKVAVIRKEGDRLVLAPRKKHQSFAKFLASLKPIEEEFPEIPELPHDQPPDMG